ncbi:MAG: LysM peptidoglycan-binding domain-containing protein [Dorea sp.]|nr:LysM peptidoglycan-binding domain-containing protein [Dorea sp.]
MEREFPKNVKQIGNVCDEPKIYVEDYVDTYLNQLKEQTESATVGAVLTGEILKLNDQDVVYVAGALKVSDVEMTGTEVRISKEAWDKLEEEKQRFFSGQEMVGWCLIGEGQPASLNKGVKRVHERRFKKDNTIFVWRDAASEEEVFYANKFGELMQMGGHYIFYEKNPSMQNYMINTRKKIGVTPSEMVEDRAAKNFRSAVKEKMEYKEQRQNARFAYAVSIALVVVVLVIGVSTINNYDKMEAVQNSLEVLSQSVTSPREPEPKEEQEAGEPKEAGAPKSPEEVETVSKEVTAKDDAKSGADTSGDDVQGDGEADISEKKGSAGDSGAGESSAGEDAGTADSGSGLAGGQSGLAADAADVQSPSGNGDYYVVQKGDTLDKISIKIYGNRSHVDAICRMNGLSDGNLIIIGQKLMLP